MFVIWHRNNKLLSRDKETFNHVEAGMKFQVVGIATESYDEEALLSARARLSHGNWSDLLPS
jgi:hypothetical protein